jgi:hypothetical protein
MDLNLFLNKVKVFLNPDKASYWHSITRCAIDKKPEKVDRYYLNFESKLNYPEKMDDNGIPLWRTDNEAYFYHPIVIAQYALGIYEHLHQKNFDDNNLKEKFFAQVKWLKENCTEIGNSKVWLIYYDIPLYKMVKPWYSALAQGEVISVLVRAYLLNKDESLLSICEDAINPFFEEVKNGGLINYFEGVPVYEEYPSNYKTVAVLNGFMFSLFGLFDLFLLTKSKKAEILFNQGINSIKKLLPYFDTGYWARYYLFDYPKEYVASFTYISIMFEQLKVLHLLTGEEIFNEYSKKWKQYSENNIYKMRALIKKIFYANSLK